MISITRPAIPNILATNQIVWRDELLNSIAHHGSYTDIPNQIKSSILNYYKNHEIKSAVHGILAGKCIYCETLITTVDYPQIEHFKPKSLYPDLTFEWTNLFPSCTKCNISKGELDTVAVPIVNPEVDDPELFFAFEELRIKPAPTSPNQLKSSNTISHCDLRRVSLSREYSKIICGFYETEKSLSEALDHYNGLTQQGAKLKKANEIMEALDNLKTLCEPTSSFAGYVRYVLRNSPVITSCIGVVNSHAVQLGVVVYSI